MTRSAFDFEARLTGGEAGAASEAIAVLTNVGAGHMAPTYVTPRIEMDFILVDGQGKEIGEPSEPTVIQRHVVLGGKDEREVFDTRLAQGASAEARWSVERVPGAAAVVARVRCIPDHYYEQFFEQRLTRYPADGEPHRLLQQALDEARARRFVIFEERLELD